MEANDADLEIMAMSQVGAALVKQGHVVEGFAFLGEAMAGALAGHGGQLDTVVFTTCTMRFDEPIGEGTGDSQRPW